MAFEQVSAWISKLNFGTIISGDFSGLIPVFYLAIGIAAYAVLIWHFYRFVARRDCFKTSYCNYPQIISFLKYFFAFPFVAFLFFLGFVFLMFFITKNLDVEIILTTSFALILAIRITAYYSEDLSKDVAKMLPFALLGVFIVDPSYFNFEAIELKLQTMPSLLTQAVQFIFVIVLIEWILRILLTLRNAVFSRIKIPA